MENGWVKLFRKIKDSSIFQDEYTLQLWIYILVSVNHKQNKFLFNNEEMVINPGSGIFGMNQIVSDLKNLNNPNKPKFKKFKTIYYRKLKLLEKLGKVKLQPTNKFTVITVVKWTDHQQIETQLKLKRNSTETQLKTNKNEEECIKNEEELKDYPENDFSGNAKTEEIFYITKKKRKLKGKRLETFERFWNAFNYKKDKANATDSWIDIPLLTEKLVDKICEAAKSEAGRRKDIKNSGCTPIYAQGWLSNKRWEDEIEKEETYAEWKKRQKEEGLDI